MKGVPPWPSESPCIGVQVPTRSPTDCASLAGFAPVILGNLTKWLRRGSGLIDYLTACHTHFNFHYIQILAVKNKGEDLIESEKENESKVMCEEVFKRKTGAVDTPQLRALGTEGHAMLPNTITIARQEGLWPTNPALAKVSPCPN